MEKSVSLSDFLTPAEITRAAALFKTAAPGTFAQQCEQEIIRPALARINTALGQLNNARYLAYLVEFAFMQSKS